MKKMLRCCHHSIKPGENLIFLKNGKDSKIAKMVQGSLENFQDLG